MLGPVIEGDRVRLEPPRLEQAPAFQRWLANIDWRTRAAESGIMIGDKREWRRGRASEAMRLRTEYAFRELGLRKVWTGVWLPNHGSRRALEKAGYRQCGLMRRHFFGNGQWFDVWLAEIHRDDWERARHAV